MELLVVAVCGVLSGADTFIEIEVWAKEKQAWLRQHLQLKHGIPSHDSFSRVFAAIDPDEVGAAFRRWVSQVLPTPDSGEVVAVDGKTSRRSGRSAPRPYIWPAPLPPGLAWFSDNVRRPPSRTRRPPFPNCWQA